MDVLSSRYQQFFGDASRPPHHIREFMHDNLNYVRTQVRLCCLCLLARYRRFAACVRAESAVCNASLSSGAQAHWRRAAQVTDRSQSDPYWYQV